MQENKPYVVWPSSVAPFHILMSEDIKEEIKECKKEIRCKVFKVDGGLNESNIVVGQCMKEGCPVALFRKDKEIFYKLTFTGEVGKLVNFEILEELLRKSDSAISENNQIYFSKCLNEHKVEFLCKKCENNLTELSSLGNYYPEDLSDCERCGLKNSPKKLLLSVNIRKSINEKLINKQQKDE